MKIEIKIHCVDEKHDYVLCCIDITDRIEQSIREQLQANMLLTKQQIECSEE